MRPCPAITRRVPAWTTRGSTCPNRARLPRMASRFRGPWVRALAGSSCKAVSATRRTSSPWIVSVIKSVLRGTQARWAALGAGDLDGEPRHVYLRPLEGLAQQRVRERRVGTRGERLGN